MFFNVLNPLMDAAARGEGITLSSLPDLPQSCRPHESTSVLWPALLDKLKEQSKQGRGYLWRSIIDCFGLDYFIIGCCQFLNAALELAGCLVLRELVRNLEDNDRNDSTMLWMVGKMGVCGLLKLLVHSQLIMNKEKSGSRLCSALVSSAYRKCLQTPQNAMEHCADTILTVDVERVTALFCGINDLWIVPVQIGAVMVLLFSQVKIAFAAGLIVIVLLSVVNWWVSTRIQSISRNILESKDKRVSLIGQVLKGMHQIKVMTWETYFELKVGAAREEELGNLSSQKYLDAYCVYFWASTSVLFLLCTFSLHVMLGHEPSADSMISAAALFGMLVGPLNSFPWIINGTIEGFLSIQRLEVLISTRVVECSSKNELCPSSFPKGENEQENSAALSLQNAAFAVYESVNAHGPDEQFKIVLSEITFRVRQGSMVAVVGAAGSGKSLLLSALAGELGLFKGDLKQSGRIGYVTQAPWIMSGSIRENVVLGKPFNEARFMEVLQACALDQEFNVSKGGDLVDVGSRGCKLSVGQRCRLALARAVYCDADVYLVDDVLSSVDPHVGNWLIRHVLAASTSALCNKTRIIVAKNEACIRLADQVVHMHEGKVQQVVHQLPQIVDWSLADSGLDKASEGNWRPEESAVAMDSSPKSQEELVQHSHLDSYFRYCRIIGYPLIAIVLISMSLMQITRNGSDMWLAKWINSIGESDDEPAVKSFRLFVTFGVANSIFAVFRSISFATAGLTGARRLHETLVSNVLHAPTAFLESVSLGSLLSWFSFDTERIDSNFPFIANIFLANVFSFLGACLTLGMIQPLVLALMALLIMPPGRLPGMIAWHNKHKRAVSEVHRLKRSAMAPVHALFTESLDGVTVIRASETQQYFHGKMESLLEVNEKLKITGAMMNRWINVRLEFTSILLTLTVTLVAALGISGEQSASFVGLGITYALPLMNLITGILTTAAETDLEMVSVKRILDSSISGTEMTKSKRENKMLPILPFQTAPLIEFENVVLRYEPKAPQALTGFTLAVLPGEKVALCGRTGAGKSSVFNAVLKMVEIEEGAISIDGKSIGGISAVDVRSLFSTIPQVPYIFDGTVQENLDPVSKVAETEILTVLHEVGLMEALLSLDKRTNENSRLSVLEVRLSNEAMGLSHSEKQLLCLARAVLHKSKCLLLDEFTSGVHKNCSSVMRNIISKHFGDATVVEIAHDLHGILGYDRVVVLSNGQVVEQGKPADLQAETDSIFSSMVKALN